MDTFSVGPSGTSIAIRLLVVAVLIVLAWRMASARFEGVQAVLGKAILAFGLCGFAWLSWQWSREGVRVDGDVVEVTWFASQPHAYAVTDIRFFDVQGHVANPSFKPGHSRRYDAILLSFSDSAYIDVPLQHRNGPRLLAYLKQRGVREGIPPGRTFRRAY
jgi:hypothetical protein